MKSIYLLFCFLLLTGETISQELNYEWHFAAQGVEADLVLSSTIDASGNSILVGNFEEELTVGDTTYTGEEFAINGIIIKLDPDGEVMWSRVIWAEAFDDIYPYAVEMDPDGNIVVAGSHWGRVDADPTDDERILDSGSSDDIFFARYSSDGDLLFATSITAGTDIEERVLDMVIDEEGIAYCAGYVDGSPNRNSDDPVLFQLIPDGDGIQVGWNYYVSTPGELDGIESIVLSGDHIYITGGFIGEADFQPGDEETILDAGDSQDLFVVKLFKDGELSWVTSFSSLDEGGECIGESIEVDDEGGVFIAGDYDGRVDFDPGEGEVIFDAFLESFLVKLDSDGAFEWAWTHDDLFTRDVIINSAGNPFVASERDEFVTVRKLTTDGDLAWIQQLEGESSFDISLRGINFDASENLYVTTNFSGSFKYDPESDDAVEAVGDFGEDMLYIKFSQDEATPVLDNEYIPGITVFPNPVVEQLNLEFSQADLPVRVELHNLQGKLLHQKIISNDSDQLDFPYPPGAYYLSFTGNDFKTSVKILK